MSDRAAEQVGVQCECQRRSAVKPCSPYGVGCSGSLSVSLLPSPSLSLAISAFLSLSVSVPLLPALSPSLCLSSSALAQDFGIYSGTWCPSRLFLSPVYARHPLSSLSSFVSFPQFFTFDTRRRLFRLFFSVPDGQKVFSSREEVFEF